MFNLEKKLLLLNVSFKKKMPHEPSALFCSFIVFKKKNQQTNTIQFEQKTPEL